MLRAKAKSENIDAIVRILKLLGENDQAYVRDLADSVWGRVSLRLIGDSGNLAHYDRLVAYATGKFDPETKCQASIALGSLISKNFAVLMPRLVNSLG